MNRAIKIVSGVLVAFAVLLAVAAWSMSTRAAPAAASGNARPLPNHPVVVLRRAVKAGQPIGADALQIDVLPVKIEGAFTATGPLVGRRAAVDLSAGTPVLEVQLISGLALKVAPGERAVAVKVDEVIGVAHRVRPGDIVDVFVVLKRDDRELDDSGARLLLPALRVLAYGAGSIDAPADAGPQAQGDTPAASSSAQAQSRRDQPRSAVLAVPVEQVAVLMLAEQSARLGLALRHPEDKALPALQPLAGARAVLPAAAASAGASAEDRALAGLTLSSMSGAPGRTATGPARTPKSHAKTPASARSAPPGRTVEVLRGAKQEHIPL